MIYRFRIILDNDAKEEDVFRDIEIEESATLEDLHNIIVQSFGFDGLEMASFYISDEHWNQGEEITLFQFSKEVESKLMNETAINSVVHEAQTKLIYIYDFFKMWTFLVELAEIVEKKQGGQYPNLMFAHGIVPEEPPLKEFELDDRFDIEGFNDGLDSEDYESLDFDENWN